MSPNRTANIAAGRFSAQPELSQPIQPDDHHRLHLEFDRKRSPLKIYNLQGQEIKTLVDGMAAAGSYAVNWDGTDHAGQKVPQWLVYLCSAG